MPDPDAATPSRKHAFAAVWLTVFIDLVGFSIIFPLFPAMLEWYLPRESDGGALALLTQLFSQWAPEENNAFFVAVLFGGLLGTLYSMLQFFAAPLWGSLSDTHGRRRILLITASGTALSYLLWIFSGSFWVLIIARVLGGAMAGNIAVASAAMADLSAKEKRTQAMALIGVAFGLGFILGPAIGGLGSLVPFPHDPESSASFALTPFSFPALVAFGLSLINVLWIWKAFPETVTEAPRESPGLLQRFRFGSHLPDVRRALKVYFLFILAFSGMEFTLTFLALERLFYQPHQMSLMFLFVGFMLAFSQGWFVRKFARPIGERNIATLGLLLSVVALLILSFANTPSRFYLGLAFLGFGSGCASPGLSSLVSLYTPADRQGSSMGAFRSMGALGRALGPLIGAMIFGLYTSETAYIASAALIFVAFLFSLLLPKPSLIEATRSEPTA
jgi:MFS family permease